MLRPAPWQAEPKAKSIPFSVPDNIYEAVPLRVYVQKIA